MGNQQPSAGGLARAARAAGRGLILAVLALTIIWAPLTSHRLAYLASPSPLASPPHPQAQRVGQASHSPSPAPTRSPATPSGEPAGTGEPTASAATDKPSPNLSIAADGMIRSDAVGDGTWVIAPTSAISPRHGLTARYVLQIEGGSGVDPDQAAATVAAVLNDERGWPAIRDISFLPVSDPAAADFTLSIATPATVDALCAPLDTEGTWSCRNGSTVNLNSDRWTYLVPWISDAATYRSYLINHEVGHWLGYEHVPCQGPGLRAPTMMQQSKGLDQCVANPWPTLDDTPAS